MITRIDLHAALANQAALELAGIDEHTTIEGGLFQKGKDGKLTGLLIDKAIGMVAQHFPPIPLSDWKKRMLQAQEDCFALGLTTLCEAKGSPYEAQLIKEMQAEKQLKIRLNYMYYLPDKKELETELKKGHFKNDKLR